jgi:hypothetical protein
LATISSVLLLHRLPAMKARRAIERAHAGARLIAAVVLFILGAGDLSGAPTAFAQGWPPPPRTVPSIGSKTPDPTTAYPGAVPSIGPKAPDPTTAYPSPIPSIGTKATDPTTAYPGATPSIGSETPDPTTAYPGAVPSIGSKTPDPTTVP